MKYHLGATGVHRSPDARLLDLTLASNPSHLEAVDPVVEGMTRAKQDRRNDTSHTSTLAVLIHGDAAFAGQGVVAETFNLSQLPGYRVGGTIHVVVNNQVGFTTAAELGRSSLYATDVAKMVQAPIFHVNGDDPEACVRVARLAFAYRARFARDVVIDMVCYRRYGHNEADEPAYTQPAMYGLIDARRSIRKLYTEAAHQPGRHHGGGGGGGPGRLPGPPGGGVLRDPPVGTADRRSRSRRRRSTSGPATTGRRSTRRRRWSDWRRSSRRSPARPTGFVIHPKLEKQIQNRRTSFEAGTVDWALAESLAFGTLLLDGTPVRLAGQDSRRGTFSQRHAVLVDYQCEAEHVPLGRAGPGPGVVPDLRLAAVGVRRPRASTTATRSPTPTRWCCGRRSSATSSTAARSSSTSSSWPPRTSGARRAASCCCCPTASRARARSTPAPGWSGS